MLSTKIHPNVVSSSLCWAHSLPCILEKQIRERAQGATEVLYVGLAFIVNFAEKDRSLPSFDISIKSSKRQPVRKQGVANILLENGVTDKIQRRDPFMPEKAYKLFGDFTLFKYFVSFINFYLLSSDS